MPGARSTRLVAALTALLFFGGEAGTSGLDALLFHGSGTAVEANVTHVEPARTANHHADQCLLALRLANGRVSPPLGLAIRFEGIPSRAACAPPPAGPHLLFTGLHQQSRAPPV